MRDREETVAIHLSDDDRNVLERGLVEWGGPASCTDALAVAMGFESVSDLRVQRRRLLHALAEREPLSRWDWMRVLLATEIVFAGDVVSSGVEWPLTTGLDDVATLDVLRGLQRKLVSVRVSIGPPGKWNSS